MQQGFIKLHRKIQDHWIYQEKRKFSRYEAWLDMLMMANHKDNKFLLGNELVEVKKGSFITSELKLMEKWDWGKAKLRSFLEMLEKDGMIVKISDRKKTTINICNYCIYHGSDSENRPQTDHEQTTSRPSADTNKNVKNVKNDKEEKIYIPFSEIVSYLNEKTNSKYKASSKKTKDLIKARWNDGYTLDDFKIVIDKKTTEWLNDPKMNQYLRPETLFGTKFESYLNQKGGKSFGNSEQNYSEYNFDREREPAF